MINLRYNTKYGHGHLMLNCQDVHGDEVIEADGDKYHVTLYTTYCGGHYNVLSTEKAFSYLQDLLETTSILQLYLLY